MWKGERPAVARGIRRGCREALSQLTFGGFEIGGRRTSGLLALTKKKLNISWSVLLKSVKSTGFVRNELAPNS